MNPDTLSLNSSFIASDPTSFSVQPAYLTQPSKVTLPPESVSRKRQQEHVRPWRKGPPVSGHHSHTTPSSSASYMYSYAGCSLRIGAIPCLWARAQVMCPFPLSSHS